VTDAIVVRGITAEGRHGLMAIHDRDQPQPFVVDVELPRDLRPAAEADDLGATVNYVEIARAVREVIEQESFELVETLANAVALRVLEIGGDSVLVKVAKPRPAALIGVDEIAVVVERRAG
jgi:FolB domain-containing protein